MESKKILNDWKEKISSYKKLKLNEAQELYRKAISAKDEQSKKMYLDEVVLGTLYVVCNYIERNNLEIFASQSFDMNDIINTINELWIKRIYEGALLNIDKFSLIFTSTFFREVCNNLLSNNNSINDQFGISTDLFIELLIKYIELKQSGKPFNYHDLLDKNIYHYSCWLIPIFEKIYNDLKLDDNNLGKNKIYNFLKIILEISLNESISKNMPTKKLMEDEIIEQISFKEFVSDVDSTLKDDNQRSIIHKRYGIDDGKKWRLEEVSKAHSITETRVKQIEAKSLRLLRASKKFKKNP